MSEAICEIKLNVGCGNNKIEGYVNLDSAVELFPDVVADVRKGLPYANCSVDEILFFHTIEHIEEKWHSAVLAEFWRILKPDGVLLISYPEFKKVAQNYIDNHLGMREFWKHTIYGLQRYLGDYHVSLMDTEVLVILLTEIGFGEIMYMAEAMESYNTVVRATKKFPQKTYEEVLKEAIFDSTKEGVS